MYCQHFSLKKKPFQISSNNELLWLGKKHSTAFELLKKGITEEHGLLTLTGDIGTGKTTLINEIIHTRDSHTLFVIIEDPGFEMYHLLLVIAQAFGFESLYPTKKKFSSAFFSFLKATEEKGQKVLVIVDEAQRIPQRFLKEISSWSEFGLNHVLTIILAGQLEFQDVLKTKLKPAQQKDPIVHAFLEPLNEEETKNYINNRLEKAGATRKIFLISAVHEAYTYSKGIPRLINISCDQALLAAFAKDMKIVDVPTFKQVIKELTLPTRPFEKGTELPEETNHPQTKGKPVEKPFSNNRQWFQKKTIAGLAVICCICFGLAYLFYGYLPSVIKIESSPLQEDIKPLEYQSKKTSTLSPDLSLHEFKYLEQTLNEKAPAIIPKTQNPAKQNVGLGYTPDPSFQETDLTAPVLVEDLENNTLPEPDESFNIKKINNFPDPSNEPEPEAIIDWLMEKKNIKPQE